MQPAIKEILIQDLLANRIAKSGFYKLRAAINPEDLSIIIQRIYDLNDFQIKKIADISPLMAKANSLKNKYRNANFYRKVRGNFRNKDEHKVVVVEGDSWFNYPIILKDVVDWIATQNNLAVYSLAAGGEWLLNMLNEREYVEQLSTLHPDVFIISGGGNDLVSSNRLAAIVNPDGDSEELKENSWAQELLRQGYSDVTLDNDRLQNGLRFLTKDFYALLMFFHLQYYYLFNGILTAHTDNPDRSKFPKIRIITQGYDYALPNRDTGFGLNIGRWYKPFVRLFLGNGKWLKTPLEIRGIVNINDQKDIVYVMIHLFNEMMIATGHLFCERCGRDAVCHVDSRGAMGEHGWVDEMHPLNEKFSAIGKTFIDCINSRNEPNPVYTVKPTKRR